MQVESKASAFFNVFNAQVNLIAEGDDTGAPFTYAGDTPTNYLLSADQDLDVKLSWNVGGLIPAMTKLDYTITLYVDGNAVNAKTITAGPLQPNSTASYASDIVMPRQGVGVHNLSVTLTVKSNGPGGLNLPVAGFQDLGTIQVYPA